MNVGQRQRYYLVDGLFVLLLAVACLADCVAWRLRSPHGQAFVLGLASLACIVLSDSVRLRRCHGAILIVIISLALLPTFDIAGAGPPFRLVAFIAPVSVAIYLSTRALLRHDRLQGACGLVLALWALAIGLSNALSSYRHTGFWFASMA